MPFCGCKISGFFSVNFASRFKRAERQSSGGTSIQLSRNVCCFAVLLLFGLSVFSETQTAPTFNKQLYPSRDIVRFSFAHAADVSGDGIPDLLFCCDGNKHAWFQISTTLGGFQAPVTLGPGADWEPGVATGDFNEDGRNDVVVVNDRHSTGGITIFYNQGNNVFTPTSYFSTTRIVEVTVADFNHDNHLDLAFVRSNADFSVSAHLAKGDGAAHLAAPSQLSQSAPPPPNDQFAFLDTSFVTGNFDGDRHADLLLGITICSQSHCGATTFYGFYGNGTGTFSTKTLPATGAIQSPLPYDINQDGRTDLSITNRCDVPNCTPSFGAWIATSNRTFTQVLVQNPDGYSGDLMAVADFNGDLRNDLVQILSAIEGPQGVKVALGTSDGSWNKQVPVPLTDEVNAQFSTRFAANFTLNRKPDIVTFEPFTHRLYALVNTSTGNFGTCDFPRTGEGIRVCSPTSGSLKHSPVRFTAAATSYQPLRKIELWVDGTKRTEQYRSWLDFSISLGAGAHKVSIYAVRFDNVFKKTAFTFTVD
jgi:hypothetical protein